MKTLTLALSSALLFTLFLNACQSSTEKPVETIKQVAIDSIAYQSEDLIVKRLSEHTYQHISFLNTNDFGRVACNGMLVINDGESMVFDTPADSSSSEELIIFLTDSLKTKIKGMVATHFHGDCIGGITQFQTAEVPTYASYNTIAHIGTTFLVPIHGFDDILKLKVGGESVLAEYFGEGHTRDNVIGYFPKDDVVFGGCLIKEVGATKGYLGDAKIEAWPVTVTKLKEKHKTAKIVIPGHGEPGGTELFDYTIQLFQ